MEFIIGSGIAAVALYTAAKWNPAVSERKKIEHVFRNIGYRVKDHEPTLVRRNKKESSMEYVYSVPFGLIDDPKLQPTLEKTLSKPVEIKFRGKLIIKVYNKSLSKLIHYDEQVTNDWIVPIGYTLNEQIRHDFDSIPHMTIAGMTRQGKTVLLKLILTQLILNKPDDVEFYIIDLKGGLEFGPLEKLKQIKKVASNVREAYQVLQEVQKNIKRDMQLFRSNDYSNVLDTSIKKRTFIIVDEGAQLSPGKHHTKDEKQMFNYCQEVLSEVCRVAGALGYRNIFCTQYPTADTLPRQIKQNSDAKISFRLPTGIASRVAIDEQGAEELGNVGRAIYRTHTKHVLQVPFISDDVMWSRLGRYERDASVEKEDQASRDNTIEFG